MVDAGANWRRREAETGSIWMRWSQSRPSEGQLQRVRTTQRRAWGGLSSADGGVSGNPSEASWSRKELISSPTRVPDERRRRGADSSRFKLHPRPNARSSRSMLPPARAASMVTSSGSGGIRHCFGGCGGLGHQAPVGSGRWPVTPLPRCPCRGRRLRHVCSPCHEKILGIPYWVFLPLGHARPESYHFGR